MRQALLKHAENMEEKLQEHDYKEHWSTCSQNSLLAHAQNKFTNLVNAVCHNGYSETILEAEHLSNYCMMLADNAREIRAASSNIDRLDTEYFKVVMGDKESPLKEDSGELMLFTSRVFAQKAIDEISNMGVDTDIMNLKIIQHT